MKNDSVQEAAARVVSRVVFCGVLSDVQREFAAQVKFLITYLDQTCGVIGQYE